MMDCFHKFGDLDIDWDLSPEQAVVLYLEWGNNNWHAAHGPVRSKSDVSVYFVVDSWETPPVVRLIRRNSENAEELASGPLPERLLREWREEYGQLKGVFEPTATIKDWLRTRLYGA